MSKIQDNTNWDEKEAKAIAGLLDERANRLSMRTYKQLEDARAKAVQVHAAKVNGQVNANGTLTSMLPWLRQTHVIAAGLVCAALVFTLAAGNNYNNQDSDAFILGADIPPEALVDRGFEPWLNAKLTEM